MSAAARPRLACILGLLTMLALVALLEQPSVASATVRALVSPVVLQATGSQPTPEPAVSIPGSESPAPTDAPSDPAPVPVYPLAVMVDNFPAARPQAGLGEASIVYEALAEGGITRFLAIYTGDASPLVGPVRSARHYFVYWAAEYNAPVVHIMASDEGYAAIAHTGLPDLDEHRGDLGFLRSPDRPMPFNAYASPAVARGILYERGSLWPGSLGGFARERPPPRILRGQRSNAVRIVYPLAGFSVEWRYDATSKRYLRFQADEPHLDAATGQQIAVSTVVLQLVPAWVFHYVGGEGYVDMQLVGAGRTTYLEAGLAIEGAWHKPSLGDVTRYFDADGSQHVFRPGAIWVQVVPIGPLEGGVAFEHPHR